MFAQTISRKIKQSTTLVFRLLVFTQEKQQYNFHPPLALVYRWCESPLCTSSQDSLRSHLEANQIALLRRHEKSL